MKVIKVAIPIPKRSLFDYLVNTEEVPVIGARVEVPFGRQRLIGVVCSVDTKSDFALSQLKYISRIIDQHSIFSPQLLTWLQWSAKYYHHSVGDVFHSALPVKLRQGAENKLRVHKTWQLTKAGEQFDITTIKSNAHKQKVIMQALQGSQKLPPGATTVLKSLQQKALVEQVEQPLLDLQQLSQQLDEKDTLTPTIEQALAISAITHKQDFQCWLLDGITGSGKTEVYLQAITPVLKQAKQVLILVPEIGLTPQTVARFEKRFGVPVGALHSGLNDEQRFEVWYKAKYGHLAIVIGTRSAVFTDFKSLGMIIIDEEHDGSFKQQDSFRYHARDIATVRARSLKIPLVLGSATPSLESLYNARLGKFKTLNLTQRAGNANTAPVQVVDLRAQQLKFGLSESVLSDMSEQLVAGNQVMVFINRRGFAPYIVCHDCGHSEVCDGCERPLTVHLKKQQMHCHQCDIVYPLVRKCRKCGSHNIHYQGVGTEKLEQGLQTYFPDYSCTRIDSDSVRGKNKLNQTLSDIRTNKHQILVGTQILAKGHHFPNVTLVVIVDVDSALFSADYRAYEQLSQLIVQVSGRAGRAQKRGKVLLQTHQPGHGLLQDLINNGYQQSALSLLQERHASQLPPHSFQAVIKAEHKDNTKCIEFLTAAGSAFSSCGTKALGPLPCLVEKRQLRYRFMLLLQSNNRSELHKSIANGMNMVDSLPHCSSVKWHLDIDPYDFN